MNGIIEKIRSFAVKEIEAKSVIMDKQDEFPYDLYSKFTGEGFLGLTVPKVYGGLENNTASWMKVTEEMAKISAPSSFFNHMPKLVIDSILYHGTKEQKDKYIKYIINGDMLPAFAMTEPNSGSDAGSITTKAELEGDKYVINGEKTWVAFATNADLVLLWASTNLDKGSRGITAFVFNPKETKGFSAEKIEMLGFRGLEIGKMKFNNMEVPIEGRIGEEGEGFKIGMKLLDSGRLSISAMAIGLAESAMIEALHYSRKRKQFGQPIFNFQSIQFMIAEMATDIAAAKKLAYSGADLIDKGERVTLESSQSKMFSSDMAMKHTEKALQIHGAYGYSYNSKVQKLFREAKATQIFEGTSQIQRYIVARELVKRYNL